jgi:hypothetical protein
LGSQRGNQAPNYLCVRHERHVGGGQALGCSWASLSTRIASSLAAAMRQSGRRQTLWTASSVARICQWG